MLRQGATPLAFVSLADGGEREFAFYWRDTADQLLRPRDVPTALVASARIFHFGSIGLIHPAPRRATLHALAAARDSERTFVSCDPNVRLRLWPSASAARRAILAAVPEADLVKVNREELEFLTGHRDLGRGLDRLAAATAAALVVTLGPDGAAYRWSGREGSVPGFRVRSVDTTGAGDGFTAGLLSCLLRRRGPLRGRVPEAPALAEWVRYANAVGALTTTRRGAIPAFPTAVEVDRLLARGRTRSGARLTGS
jgi:fructokinase